VSECRNKGNYSLVRRKEKGKGVYPTCSCRWSGRWLSLSKVGLPQHMDDVMKPTDGTVGGTQTQHQSNFNYKSFLCGPLFPTPTFSSSSYAIISHPPHVSTLFPSYPSKINTKHVTLPLTLSLFFKHPFLLRSIAHLFLCLLTTMVRDDLYITVPSFFRCPISLDVMKSPVSLSTGVTYDRSSIQRWLDNGNNTCPATMQVLQTKEFVPNRTLQRLIQIWSDSLHQLHPPHSPTSTHSQSLPSKEQILLAISDLQTRADNRFDSLAKIARFAQDSEENRDFLVRTECFVPLLVGFLDNVNGGVEFLEQVVTALDLVIGKMEDREGLKNLILKRQGEAEKQSLDSLLVALRQGSHATQIASVRVLTSVAVDVESKLMIAEKEGLVSELLKLITPEKDPDLIENCLSCLVAISSPRRSKMKLVRLGAVKVLSKLLCGSNMSVSMTEKVLKLVETVSSTKEGRLEIGEDSACVAAIVNKVLKVSSVATEHAVTTLWSVCYLFRDETAQEAVTKANGLTKILLLMQSNCSAQVRQMSADLLKIFRVNSKSCLSSYDTKTTHIMPF